MPQLPVRHNSPNRLYKGVSSHAVSPEKYPVASYALSRTSMVFRNCLLRCAQTRFRGRQPRGGPYRADEADGGSVPICVHAFCVMPDHFHALVEGMSEESDLRAFVRNFKQASSKEHAREEDAPLWQKKFYDHILRSKDSPDAISWYIWMNPVRKGLCSQPIEYPYSGSLTKEWQAVLRPREQWVPTWKANPSRPSTNRTASTKPAPP